MNRINQELILFELSSFHEAAEPRVKLTGANAPEVSGAKNHDWLRAKDV